MIMDKKSEVTAALHELSFRPVTGCMLENDFISCSMGGVLGPMLSKSHPSSIHQAHSDGPWSQLVPTGKI